MAEIAQTNNTHQTTDNTRQSTPFAPPPYPDQKQQDLIRYIYKTLLPTQTRYDSATVNRLFETFYIENETNVDRCLDIIFDITRAAQYAVKKRESYFDPDEIEDVSDNIDSDIVFLTIKYQEMYNTYYAKKSNYLT